MRTLHRHPGQWAGVLALAAGIALAACGPASAQSPPPIQGQAQDPAAPGVLGNIPGDYEVHGELVLVSGQLEGFAQTCGFGRKPDRNELFRWYEHHRLARNLARIQGIYELGVELGKEGPCTAEHNRALVGHWQTLLNRTQAYVEAYR